MIGTSVNIKALTGVGTLERVGGTPDVGVGVLDSEVGESVGVGDG